MKNNIAIFRKELGMTQKQLAHAIGMSVEDLNAIENNTLEPTLIDANNIVKALKKEYIAEVFMLKELD
ncbi:MAG: helix-turn-helix domain-containing protein [Methanobrevibacter sp.]|uniref:helix-turn-helix transcriptional regulator n=1 Tax=Methanobrevibacter sp. TaxID=66852 RepID=UPI002600691A|nr:helix-turn-helix domain-containing protein [Methanobrevibacter sp.]MBQ8016532.1 helix-turn-helix domain-containing protein [Methanobrevibacter sp.]